MSLNKFIESVAKLGEEINSEWDGIPETFSGLAREHLEKFESPLVPGLEEFHSSLPSLELPAQTFDRDEFSDFPITLYRTDGFCIDMYYWLSSDTHIHDHHFAGAFKMIEGSSYQIEYDFKVEQKLDENISLGILTKKKVSDLTLSKVEEIKPRTNFIHHVFHFGKPTVTSCVRLPSFENEYLSVYLYPDFCINLKTLPASTIKWLCASGILLKKDNGRQLDLNFTTGQLISIHTSMKTGKVPCDEKVIAQIEKKLEQEAIGERYLNTTKNQMKLLKKIRFMGRE